MQSIDVVGCHEIGTGTQVRSGKQQNVRIIGSASVDLLIQLVEVWVYRATISLGSYHAEGWLQP